tara:strand:+ start:162 stop:824 length:663 start_codon:yes stop_codon:yes gene_type:complete
MDHTISNLIRIKEEINLNNTELNKNITPKIIAVSKTFSEDKVIPLIEYGHIDFGENKVQEAVTKWTKLKEKNINLKLHMIGKLQTNKVKHAVKIFDYIHSLDSIKLAQKISQEQIKVKKDIKLFIQINIGNETQKSGININDLEIFYKNCVKDLKLNVVGLMCIPPNDENIEKYFLKMNELKKNFNVNELSMGMSNDYLIALKHDTTFLRIGSKIFGPRN